MSLRRSTSLVVVALLVLLSAENRSYAESNPTPIELLVTKVQDALLIVNTEIAKGQLPPLKYAEIQLKTAISRDGAGKISFSIISLGSGVRDEQIQEITLRLSPPPITTPQPSSPDQFAVALAEAVTAAARGGNSALLRKPPLELASLDAVISFAVNREGEIGFGLLKFVPITLEFNGKLTKSEIQQIRVVFEK